MDDSKTQKKMKFIRKDAILKKLKNAWRRPKGLHNKLRLNKAGHQKKPSIGYKKPVTEKPLLVKNLKDLNNIKSNFILASTIGTKKKIEIIKKAQEQKLQILNIKDINAFLKKVEEKQKKKKDITKKKEEKKKKFEEKAKEKTEEEKKIEEKQERKKVLEKGH